MPDLANKGPADERPECAHKVSSGCSNSKLTSHWIEERVQRGLQQGHQEGMQQATQAVLLRILRRRFGRLPIQFTERVESLTAGQMEGLVDVALSAEDLGAFEQELAACGPLSTVNN